MDMEIYDAEARLADGTILRASGTIQQMANWADNLIRSSGQDSDIKIRRRQQDGDLADDSLHNRGIGMQTTEEGKSMR